MLIDPFSRATGVVPQTQFRVGYVAIALGLGRTTSHSTLLRKATPARLEELIDLNLTELQAILEYNAAHNIRLFRVGSGVIPFGSHPVNTLPWWTLFRDRLAAIGAYAQKEALRLSMHPGQYTVLNSLQPGVVESAVRDLVYHARFLDALGLNASHKLVLHLGGVYADKPGSQQRFVEVARQLPASVRARLALEHDDRNYTAHEVLAVAESLRLPVVYDNLHDRLNPSAEPPAAWLPRLAATWQDDVPKVHFSSPAPGQRRGAHAYDADPDEFSAFLDLLRPLGKVDIMLEAKGKDLALLALALRIPELNLTPPNLSRVVY